LQLAKWVQQGNYYEFEANEIRKKYWTTKYRVEGLTHLQALVDNTMKKETFTQVTQPVFMGYYYKNDTLQDKVVSVPAMLKMYKQLGTPLPKKRKMAFPEAENHVIASHITSQDIKAVQKETNRYIEEVLRLVPIQ